MSSNPQPKVFVVTPFYNTAEFLAECIESVLAQSYENFEYLLVDNASTDGSAEIAASYLERDPRVRLIHNETLLSQVRNYNHALRQLPADAAYCKMVQADDFLFPRCLTEMVELAEAHPEVGVVSSYELRGRELFHHGLPYHAQVLSGREACRLHLVDEVYLFGSPTSLLFRAELVRGRDPFYAEGRLHEDTEAVYEVLRDCDFGFVHQVLSFTRVQEDSITGAVRDFKPNLLDRYLLTKMYGRELLDQAEYEEAMGRAERRYFRFLGESALRRREQAFWDYHREGLRTIGEDLDRGALVGHAVAVAADYLLSPKTVGMALVRRARRLLGTE